MTNLFKKLSLVFLVPLLLTGCNFINYGWSNCDKKMEEMFVVMASAPDKIETSIEKEAPDGWSWSLNPEETDADWYVSQEFTFYTHKKSYRLTFNSTGSSCQERVFEL